MWILNSSVCVCVCLVVAMLNFIMPFVSLGVHTSLGLCVPFIQCKRITYNKHSLALLQIFVFMPFDCIWMWIWFCVWVYVWVCLSEYKSLLLNVQIFFLSSCPLYSRSFLFWHCYYFSFFWFKNLTSIFTITATVATALHCCCVAVDADVVTFVIIFGLCTMFLLSLCCICPLFLLHHHKNLFCTIRCMNGIISLCIQFLYCILNVNPMITTENCLSKSTSTHHTLWERSLLLLHVHTH